MRTDTLLCLRNRHFFGFDLLILCLAAYLSCALRLDRLNLTPYWPAFFWEAGLALFVYPLVYRAFGVYRRFWRYASVGDLLLLAGATLAAGLLHTTLQLILLPALLPAISFPRSLPLILTLLMLVGGAGPRLLLRAWLWQHQRRATGASPTPVLIYGAGEAGVQIVRELNRNHQLGLDVVGFVDDDPDKQRLYISGVPVLGGRDDLLALAHSHQVSQVIIAMPSAPGKVIRQLLDICQAAQVQVRTIPGLYELLSGNIKAQHLREVRIEDLLRREPVHVDDSAVKSMVQGKRVLVTGAGGSIGSELCRQILRYGPSQLILLGHGENSLFAIHNELLAALRQQSDANASSVDGPGPRQTTLIPIIADIRFADRIHAVFDATRPQLVFHAAAHKHVPLMEWNPVEAFTNNVLGTRHLLQAAQSVGVERFVMISSDKAVNPTSVMGASKRSAELLVLQAAERTGRPYVAVRFGNVLGSRGSVVLTFQQQIAAGGPLTITHPDMTRFFMTIPEAVQLVLQAGELGKGGEIFLLDMGEPVRIMDLAHDLIRLSGLSVGRDIDIAVTGVRPGEKLYEELFLPDEEYRETRHQKIFIAAHASAQPLPDLESILHLGILALEQNDERTVLRTFTHLVPEYKPQTITGKDCPRILPTAPEPLRQGLLDGKIEATTSRPGYAFQPQS